MSVVVIDPPAPVVDLALAKRHLRVETDDDDDLIAIYLAAAQGAIDGPAGWLGRAIGTQTLELRLSSFQEEDWRLPGGGYAWDGTMWPNWSTWPFDKIPLPFPPLREIVSITYEDLTGADQVLDPSGWRQIGDGVTPSFGDVWPAGRLEASAVRVRYAAGYDGAGLDPAVAGPVPPPIIAAILMATAGLWANREDVVITDTRATQIINDAATNLLAPFRVWSPDRGR